MLYQVEEVVVVAAVLPIVEEVVEEEVECRCSSEQLMFQIP
jgi:hypothetical protein